MQYPQGRDSDMKMIRVLIVPFRGQDLYIGTTCGVEI